jgi:hypothetical protein
MIAYQESRIVIGCCCSGIDSRMMIYTIRLTHSLSERGDRRIFAFHVELS